MGDMRALIKIEIDIIGIKDKIEMWINYFPNDDGIDNRIIDFFNKNYQKAQEKLDRIILDMKENEKDLGKNKSWEERQWLRLQEELPLTESDADDTIVIMKSEIFKAMQEVFDSNKVLFSNEEIIISRNVINSILESRNIKERL